MSAYFCLAFRFLDPAFHGRGEGGHYEWPPSPLRGFQSLVVAAARRHAGALASATRSALEWLELQQPPAVIAPPGAKGSGYRLSVPNNVMDIVAKAWCRGNVSNVGEANPATHRTMKPVQPMLLFGDATHYLWSISDRITADVSGHLQALGEIARSAVALGWGIDLVVGHGALLSHEEVKALSGERWLPIGGAMDGGLRVPVRGTLEDIIRRHESFVKRIGPDGFIPPHGLQVYRKVEYRRETDPPRRSTAAFSLLHACCEYLGYGDTRGSAGIR